MSLRCSTLISVVLASMIGSTSLSRADQLEETCGRLADVIRTGVDHIVAGDHQVRVMVALEAHKRLGCHPRDLVRALSLPAFDSAAREGESVAPGTADPGQ